MNALNTLLIILDSLTRHLGRQTTVLRPERLDGIGEIQTLIYTAIPSNGPKQIFLITVEQILQPGAKDKKTTIKLDSDLKFWGGYSKGIAETCSALADALRRDKWTDVEGLYKDYPEARHEIEEVCRRLGHEDRAKALRGDNSDPDGADFLP